jgi:lipid II:glycine glycyltransferase (peptidoglycan interpeptide bridge formation enzyme)
MENLTLKEITQKDKWEEIVTNTKDYTFLQSWEYGKFQKVYYKYEINRFALKYNGDVIGEIQLFHVKAKRGNILSIRHAPGFTENFYKLELEVQDELIEEVLREIINIAKDRNTDFIRIQPLIELETDQAKIFKQKYDKLGFKSANIHQVDAEKTLILDLTDDEDDILADMRKQTRYYIRRAKRDGVETEISRDMKALDKFFEIHKDTVERQEFVSFTQKYYRQMFQTLNSDPNSNLRAEVILANYEGKAISAAIIIYFGEIAYYSDGGSLTEFSKIPGSYAVQWAAIQRGKELGCNRYNFWGGVSPDKENENYPWYGIDMFKRGFGGDRIEYLHAHDKGLSWKYQLTRIWEYIERLRRGY